MNRFDLQKMAAERVADAAALLAAERYQAAYYLCGYAIECAVKACIARKTREFDFPDRKVVNDSYVHDLTKLLTVATWQKRTRMRWREANPLRRIGSSCETGLRRAAMTRRSNRKNPGDCFEP